MKHVRTGMFAELGKYCIWCRIPAKQDLDKQGWLVPNTVMVSGGSRDSGKILQFFSSLKLGDNISRISTDTKLLYKF